MPWKKYLINLNDEEWQMLLEMTRKGEIKARKFKRAMILLKADEGLSDPHVDGIWPVGSVYLTALLLA